MNSPPRISVILPNYNHASFLPQRINSILNQTWQDFELIILDDCSTDSSRDVISQYADKHKNTRVEFNQENSGSPFKQWQKGVSLARGEFVWVAESDDVADPQFLEQLYPIISQDDSIALIYAQSYDIDEHGNRLANRIYWTNDFSPNVWKHNFTLDGNEVIEKYFLHKNVIPNASAVLFRKNVFQERYDASASRMKMAGDWLLWISMLIDYKMAFVATPLNHFRMHEHTTRIHNTPQKKLRRMIEEAKVIHKIHLIRGVDQQAVRIQERILLHHWFRFFPWPQMIFQAEFYQVCGPIHLSPVLLLLKATVFKIRNKLSKP